MSECACIYAGYDASDGAYSSTNAIAVKDRTCDECGRTINIGEEYLIQYSWEDSWCEDCDDSIEECWCVEPDFVCSMCMDCNSIVDELFCDGHAFNTVVEDLSNHIRDVGVKILACDMRSLTKGARDMICDMIEDYWKEQEWNS